MHTLRTKYHSLKTIHKVGNSIDLQVLRQFEKPDWLQPDPTALATMKLMPSKSVP